MVIRGAISGDPWSVAVAGPAHWRVWETAKTVRSVRLADIRCGVRQHYWRRCQSDLKGWCMYRLVRAWCHVGIWGVADPPDGWRWASWVDYDGPSFGLTRSRASTKRVTLREAPVVDSFS